MTFIDGNQITYTYAADGTKLRTVHGIGGAGTTTDYCTNVIYENGTAKFLLTEKGYVSLNNLRYHYYLKDHQGNVRMTIYRDETARKRRVEETNHYYPFGGVFVSTTNVQPYKYNGKEYDANKGLNWHDYGARYYDIKDNEPVFLIVNQDKLTKTTSSVVMAEAYRNSLDIKIGTKAVSNMLNNNDNRTFAHELGHSGGLDHTMDLENLMTQKFIIQKEDGDYLKATLLNRSQIQTIRDNYIHNKLNRHIPNWIQRLKKRQ